MRDDPLDFLVFAGSAALQMQDVAVSEAVSGAISLKAG